MPIWVNDGRPEDAFDVPRTTQLELKLHLVRLQFRDVMYNTIGYDSIEAQVTSRLPRLRASFASIVLGYATF